MPASFIFLIESHGSVELLILFATHDIYINPVLSLFFIKGYPSKDLIHPGNVFRDFIDGILI